MSNVEPIRKDNETPKELPGFDVSFSSSIDEKRQIAVRTMFDQGTPGKERERILAGMLSTVSIIGLREKLIEYKRDQQNAQQRLADISADPEKIKAIRAEISQLQLDAGKYSQDEENKFRASGRTGQFTLVGAAKSRAQGFITDIQKKQNEISSLDADLTRQRDELQKAVKNWGIAIENAEREITIRRESYGE